MKKAGYGDDLWSKYSNLKDKIGNLELLLPHENQEKSDQPFEKWITTRDTSFKQRHLIPNNPDLWKFENFEGFIDERERLIVERLDKLFGSLDTGEA